MVEVGLVQINNSFSEANYLPYSVGLLQVYAEKHAQAAPHLRFRTPVFARLPLQQAVGQLEGCHVVGFSIYVWNFRLSMAIAQKLKELDPGVLIVMGGPQVPDRSEEFLRAHPFVDLCCHGEGEVVFSEILDRLRPGQWKLEDFADLPSLSFLREGLFVQNPRAARLKDLNVIPSPFLNGTFDEVMRLYPHQEWLGLWETNRGCPFGCTFCDWGSATQAKVYQFDIQRLFSELQWFAQQKIEFIFCCDANFGILPRDLDLAREAARIKQESGYPKALSVQNTKNATERAYQVQKTLSDFGLNKGVTLSMQSVDKSTLKNIKRDNISLNSYQELQRRFTRDQVETYSDLILGLPGETFDSFVDGLSDIITNGQHNRIQFNNLAILPNAEMGDPEYQKRFGMQTVRTRLVNIHGSLEETEDDIYEYQDLVVATDSMPRADWIRTRAFCWMASLLHFDKVLQIPLVVAHELSNLSYRDLIALFAESSLQNFPTLRKVQQFFHQTASNIQEGGTEYVQGKDWLNIYWPADEYVLIELAVNGQLAGFYEEAYQLLSAHLLQSQARLPEGLLRQAVDLNQALLKVPFVSDDVTFDCGFNLMEFYRGVLTGQAVELQQQPCSYRIDRSRQVWSSWSSWCREVIWFGNKKGAYLYGSCALERQLEGHF